MPKEKKSSGIIQKIYKRKFEDIGMLFFVDGQRAIMPAVSVEKALYNYFKYIGEENFNFESSMTTYFRLKKEFYEAAKTDSGDTR